MNHIRTAEVSKMGETITEYTLKPNHNSGKGSRACREPNEMGVDERMKMPMGYRLSRGFSLLRGNDV